MAENLNSTFAYARVEKTNSWNTLFQSINANFEGVDKFLSGIANIINYIERFTARANQKQFKVNYNYAVGQNNLAVYKNGVRLFIGLDYVEIDQNIFQLNQSATEGDIIVAVVTELGGIDTRIHATVEVQTAMQGQQTFYLEKVYKPNTHSVLVFKNGIELESGTDYEETSQYVITFTEPCDWNDNIVILANLELSAPIGNLTEMVGATLYEDGLGGLVPKPEYGTAERFLGVDGRWKTPRMMTGATSSSMGDKGLAPIPLAGDEDKVLHGSGNWRYVQKIDRVGEIANSKSEGRDIAVIKRSTYSGYAPITSQKTPNGSWEVVTEGELLFFNYILDSEYRNKTNNIAYQIIYSPTERKIRGVISNAEYADRLSRAFNLSVSGDASGSINIDGSQDVNLNLSINKLHTPVRIGLQGDLTGSAEFDGLNNTTINAVIPMANETVSGKMKLYSTIGDNIDGTMTQAAITARLSSIYRFKGSVNTYYDLPSSGNTLGDVYYVISDNIENSIPAGTNLAWNGTGWSKLIGNFDSSEFLKLSDSYVESISINGNVITIVPSNGETLSINVGNDYSLPIASATTLGGVKPGRYLSINAVTGVLDVNVPVAIYDETNNIKTNGLMSWEDKKKLDSIDLATIVKEITSVNGVQFDSDKLTVDENTGVITLTKQNIISALGYEPVSQDNLNSINSNDLENLVTSIVNSGGASISSGQVDESVKLYSSVGSNVDGTLTQQAITDLISGLTDRISDLESENSNSTIELTNSWYKMSDIFVDYQSMVEISKKLDTDALTTMNEMFKDCERLKYINPFNTANITNMQSAFSGCERLPVNFPFVINCSSISSASNLTNMFLGSSVTTVVFKNMSNNVKSNINSLLLKGDNTLIIEYR